MAVPRDKRRSYLARQVGTLALTQVRVDHPMAVARAASWHNGVARMGIYLPLFVVHDVGLLLTAARGGSGWSFGPHPALAGRSVVPPQATRLVQAYADLLALVAESEIVAKAASWRLSDDLVAMLISRILGDAYHEWPSRGKGAGVQELPLDPEVYAGADVAGHFAEFDSAPALALLGTLDRQRWHIYTCVEQIDLDTLRLLGMFKEGGAGDALGRAVDLVDLFHALRSPEANDVVNFSLELLPSVLETKRAGGAQTFAVDGYASIERRGNVDSLVLSEFAYDDEMFEQKVIDNELYYYGHERQREEERHLHYVLVDASASMRGERQVFARGLALTLAKKLSLEGDEVWVRFFDSRLYDIVKPSRGGGASVPYLLTFRSERGRNYGKVFRQLLLEIHRLQREGRRRVTIYLLTHGQCHIPVELVAQLAKLAYLYGVIILPSSEVTLEYLPLFHRHQIVSAASLGSREGRRDRALGIVRDTPEAQGREAGEARPARAPTTPPRARRGA